MDNQSQGKWFMFTQCVLTGKYKFKGFSWINSYNPQNIGNIFTFIIPTVPLGNLAI